MGMRQPVMSRQEAETLETYLPQVRCDNTLKERLARVASQSVSPRLSDHVRVAVERYVAQQEAALGISQN